MANPQLVTLMVTVVAMDLAGVSAAFNEDCRQVFATSLSLFYSVLELLSSLVRELD